MINKHSSIFSLLLIFQIVYANSFSIGINGSYAPTIKEKVVFDKEHNNQYSYELTLRNNFDKILPITTGIKVSYSNKNLINYVPQTINHPSETAGRAFGWKSDVQLFTIEFPMFYHYAVSNGTSLNSGFHIGIAYINLIDKFRFHNRETGFIEREDKFSFVNSELIITPGIEYQTSVSHSLSILFSVSYRLLGTEFIHITESYFSIDPDLPSLFASFPRKITKFDFTGMFFSLGMHYYFNKHQN